ncbi:MAG: hypothetical protein WCK77_10250 [Verrucomicrobiota bacterium]
MTKNLRNIPEAGPLLEHSTGKGVTKQMCCDLLWAFNSHLRHCAAHNMADTRLAGQRHARGVCAQEDPLRRPNTPIQTQITGKRGTNLTGQWKEISSASFSTDQDFTCPPADVSEFQCKDFAGSKPQSCQQEQDGQITAPSSGVPIRRTQDPINLLRRQLSGNIRMGPPAHRRNSGGQVVADLPLRVEKAQKSMQTRPAASNAYSLSAYCGDASLFNCRWPPMKAGFCGNAKPPGTSHMPRQK